MRRHATFAARIAWGALFFFSSPLAIAEEQQLPTLIRSAAPDWPQWRGPRRDGVSEETGLLPSWPAGGPKSLGKISGIGKGYSSPILSNDRLVFRNSSREFGGMYGVRFDGMPYGPRTSLTLKSRVTPVWACPNIWPENATADAVGGLGKEYWVNGKRPTESHVAGLAGAVADTRIGNDLALLREPDASQAENRTLGSSLGYRWPAFTVVPSDLIW